MKRIIITTISLFTAVIVFTGCKDQFLDLEPQDTITETAYFETPQQFKAASNDFYNKLMGWNMNGNIFDFMDFGSDLIAWPQPYGRGVVQPQSNNTYWSSRYSYIRANNILLQKAQEYEGDPEEIAQYVAAAKFFRAYHHFFLLQLFGGVPIVTDILDTGSPELLGARNSRYEVVQQILTDLNEAIPDLPTESSIPVSEKGHISSGAAQALKAKVLLYEGTWEKYVGNSTDGDGESVGAGTAEENAISPNEYFDRAVESARAVMEDDAYSLWNYDDQLDNLSSYFLFNLEDEGSNPAGLTKASNNEFILYQKYDYNLKQGGTNLSHTVTSGRLAPSRKFMDMILAEDGLPISQSPLFEGYENTIDEYQNRDYRLVAYFTEPEDGSVNLTGPPNGSGYAARKFAAYNFPSYRETNEESQDYPIIRLAEVYLIYAEALYERDGSISDADLDASINQVRVRAGLPPLTNSFVQSNGLDMLEEIRRERTVELFGENSRFNDLKRWGIAEEELNEPILGSVIEGTVYEDNPDRYNPNGYPYGEQEVETGPAAGRRAVVLDPASNRNFERTHYLYPIPLEEMNLNPNLTQNPGY